MKKWLVSIMLVLLIVGCTAGAVAEIDWINNTEEWLNASVEEVEEYLLYEGYERIIDINEATGEERPYRRFVPLQKASVEEIIIYPFDNSRPGMKSISFCYPADEIVFRALLSELEETYGKVSVKNDYGEYMLWDVPHCAIMLRSEARGILTSRSENTLVAEIRGKKTHRVNSIYADVKFYSIDMVDELTFSEEDSDIRSISSKDDSEIKYAAVRGDLQNLRLSATDTSSIISGFVEIGGEKYDAEMLCPKAVIQPFEVVPFYMYALIPQELAELYETCSFTFKFNDDYYDDRWYYVSKDAYWNEISILVE